MFGFESIFETYWDWGESYPEHQKYNALDKYNIKKDLMQPGFGAVLPFCFWSKCRDSLLICLWQIIWSRRAPTRRETVYLTFFQHRKTSVEIRCKILSNGKYF